MNKLQINSMWASVLLLAVLSSFTGRRPAAQRETRPVGPFSAVSLGGAAHVVVKQGTPQSVVVEASPEALADFETTVKDGQLQLGYRQNKNDYQFRDRGPVAVFVTVPSLKALKVAGSGKLEMDGFLRADALMLSVSGSGSLVVPQLTATALSTAVTGSGNVRIGSGSCSTHEIRISGSGQLRAHDLKSETCTARISGSGNAHVSASRSANASISGSGSLYVAGGAQLRSSLHGSGRVLQE